MAGKDLGTKHVCFKCGTRFYDLKKPEPICPKCGADQRQSPAAKPAEKRRAQPKPPPPPAPEVEADAEADDDEDDDDEDDDDE
jgi:predicted  nucleic acid-binding Zn-ribbon protein